MFREMVRFKQAISQEECIEILKTEPRGILSVLGDDDYPYGTPINQFYDEKTGKLYFHTANFGHRVDAIKKHDKASFCTYDKGFVREGEWALNIKSVVVFGRIEILEDKAQVEDICRRLSYKFTDDEDYIQYEMDQALDRVLVFALVPEHISGKLVNEC